MSTKDWGYWYDAFQQLMDLQSVNVGIGLTLPYYWSGPIEVASSNPNHTDKWGYFYDGSTNYIINPYLRDNAVLEYEKRFGPTNVMKDVTNSLEGVLELTVFNPKNFGKEEEVVHLNGNSYIRLSAQSVWYGKYTLHNEKKDAEYIQSALKTNQMVSYIETIDSRQVKKAFVPVDTKTKEPYVIGLAYDYSIIQDQLNKELKNYLYSSIGFMFLVLLISFIFSNSITKPIALIVNHVNEIAGGNFGRKLNLNRKDELGHLVKNVNALSDSLKSYTDDLQKSQELITFQAFHDPLTSLPNRRFIQDKLQEMLLEAKPSNRIVAVMFIDIDRFKHINDSMGHNTGDLLIKQIATRIRECLKNDDTVVARQGGDEFIILLNETSEDKVEEIANTLVSTIKKPYQLQGREIFIGASCGISFYPKHADDMDNLIVYADLAMYSAKKQGGNKVAVYNPAVKSVTKERLDVEAHFRRAIQDETLEVYYQPKFDAKNNKIIGTEALVRWNDRDLGSISPCVFVPIAEEIGLIQPLFEIVLKKSLAHISKWNKQLENELSVSVNVSPIQFLESKTLLDSIKKALADAEFPPELLEIEITETALLNNFNETIEALEELNRLGVSVSVDDFGTGYSSLQYLRKLPINTLKIDQSFVKDINEDGTNSEISEAIIYLAKSLRLDIIAEGVERDYQRDYLLSKGCSVMQGYLFAKPLNEQQFSQYLFNSNKEVL